MHSMLLLGTPSFPLPTLTQDPARQGHLESIRLRHQFLLQNTRHDKLCTDNTFLPTTLHIGLEQIPVFRTANDENVRTTLIRQIRQNFLNITTNCKINLNDA